MIPAVDPQRVYPVAQERIVTVAFGAELNVVSADNAQDVIVAPPHE